MVWASVISESFAARLHSPSYRRDGRQRRMVGDDFRISPAIAAQGPSCSATFLVSSSAPLCRVDSRGGLGVRSKAKARTSLNNALLIYWPPFSVMMRVHGRSS